MKTQNQIKKNGHMTGKNGQAKPSKAVVRREMKKLSRTARLLSVIAAAEEKNEAVRLTVKMPRPLAEAVENRAANEGLNLSEFCEKAVLVELKKSKEEDSLHFFVAGAIRHARRMAADREDVSLFLLGFFGLLCQAGHPARGAVGLAYMSKGEAIERFFDQIQLGDYSAALA